MFSYIKPTILAALLIVIPVIPSVAFAQNGKTDGVAAEGADYNPANNAGSYSAEDLKSMSKGERQEKAAEALDRMRGILAILVQTIEEKRDDRDILMLNCLSSRLSAVKGFLKIAEQANVSLQSGTDDSSDLHQLNMIFLADSRVQTLKDEADACSGGETTQYTGPTRTVLKINDDVRQETPLDSANFLNDVPLERLPEATPYQ